MAWQVYFQFGDLDSVVVLALGMVSAAAQVTLATVLWMHEEAVLASSQSNTDFLRCAPAASLNRYGKILFGSSSPLCNDCSIISLAEVAS